MATSTMAALGRRGGLRGGAARAASLSPGRRAAIARQAARARWTKPVLVLDARPRDHAELLAFVAHYGARVSRSTTRCDLDDVALRAVRAARRDAGLARMLPVFLWRARRRFDLGRLAAKARRREDAAALGYFLEVAAKLGAFKGFDGVVASLRRGVRSEAPSTFFDSAARNPFEAMAAAERTPAAARRWGLLTGTPNDSFASYFRKVASL